MFEYTYQYSPTYTDGLLIADAIPTVVVVRAMNRTDAREKSDLVFDLEARAQRCQVNLLEIKQLW